MPFLYLLAALSVRLTSKHPSSSFVQNPNPTLTDAELWSQHHLNNCEYYRGSGKLS